MAHFKSLFFRRSRRYPNTNAAGGEAQVDFSAQQGVYVLYDGGFRIVYIGQVGAGEQLLKRDESPGPNQSRLLSRLRSHATDEDIAERWERFSWFGLRNVTQDGNGILAGETISLPYTRTRVALDHLEAILIAVAEPPHNRKRGNLRMVRRYLQVPKNEVV